LLKAQRIEEPGTIHYENINIRGKEKLEKNIIAYGLCLLLLAGVIYFIYRVSNFSICLAEF